MTTEKKRHHFVPVTYMNNFCDEDGRIFAYRKDEPEKALYLRPDEIAFERYYYSQPLPDGGTDNNSLENFFGTIETKWPEIVSLMKARSNLNSKIEEVIQFVGLMRVRVPAARDIVEVGLSRAVMTTMRRMDEKNLLPPKPEGHEDILDKIEVSIDPHRSIHAMPGMALRLGRIVNKLGLRIVCNETPITLITSDNPVVYFDPDVVEGRMAPYGVNLLSGRIEMLFPISPKLLLVGHTDFKSDFAANGFRYSFLRSAPQVRRINRLIAKFGYRFIFSQTREHEPLVMRHAALSPTISSGSENFLDGDLSVPPKLVFGHRPRKPKWKGGRRGPAQ